MPNRKAATAPGRHRTARQLKPGAVPDSESIRRWWLPQLIVLGLVALAGTIPFWLTDLDIQMASVFYHRGANDPWFEAHEPLWSFFYIASPLLVGLLVLGGLLVLAASTVFGRWQRVRVYAVFIAAAVLLGPGLIINGIVKDAFERPRPNQIEQLGGTLGYLPPLAPGGNGGGKSFPSGHSSVGYVLGAFFLIWRRRRPVLAWSALGGSLVLGTLIGVARMAAGDHFVSDVIWSWVFAYGIAWILYYPVLRIPRREDAAALNPPPAISPPKHPALTVAAYATAAVAVIVLVLAASPVNLTDRELIRSGEHSPEPRVLRIVADQADLDLFWPGGDEYSAVFMLKARGFGFPGSRVERGTDAEHGVATYRLAHAGFFTEKDTRLTVGIVPDKWARVDVRIGSGNIRIHPNSSELPSLDLHTGDGEVVRLAP